MKVTDKTRNILKYRRAVRSLEARGFEYLEGPWELDRGSRTDERIVDVVIDPDGRDVWIKCAKIKETVK